VTKKATTHNCFYRTVTERDDALIETFEDLNARPHLMAGHVERFL
jgi:hypothetical protein